MTGKRVQTGFTLIEVLVTFLVTTIGLLGLAALQVNTINNGFEAQQRALVTALVDDMAERVRMNPVGALENFQSFDPETPCPAVDVNAEAMTPELRARWNKCQWAATLRGLLVKANDTDNLGLDAPIGAMGCLGTSTRSGAEVVVRVAVAWQGLTPQVAPFASCGTGEFTNADLGAPTVDESFRRVVYRDVVVR